MSGQQPGLRRTEAKAFFGERTIAVRRCLGLEARLACPCLFSDGTAEREEPGASARLVAAATATATAAATAGALQ